MATNKIINFMSKTYQLTAEIHNLINQINQKKGLKIDMSSHSINNIISQHFPNGESEYLESLRIDNIQKLLIDLDLGIIELEDERFKVTMLKSIYYDQKWFSLNMVNNKATLSLWNSGEEGQVQVLTELKEVLKNYLNN